ncbi:hypothetical protein WJX73_005949 [Symbiochloris irregularis]|uniref:UFSP1/2/DUB catalytic domain-containing protein n=1 Tax=Symbiochloris irregularis TaxID=706552 RepID=A0AAW1NTU4_9CHLO
MSRRLIDQQNLSCGITGCIGTTTPLDLDSPRDLQADYDQVTRLLPAGFVIGGACVTLASTIGQACSDALHNLPQALWQPETGSNLLLVLCKGAHTAFYQADRAGRVKGCQVDVTAALQTDLVPLHLKLTAKLQVYREALDPSVRAAFSAVTEELCGDDVEFIAGPSDAGHLLRASAPAEQTCSILQRTSAGVHRTTSFVQVTCLVRRPPRTNQNGRALAPVIQWQPLAEATTLQTATLELDVLAYAPSHMPLADAAQLLKGGIRRQLQAMQASTLQLGAVQPHCAGQFQLPGWPHCLTVVFPISSQGSEGSEDLTKQRLRLHARGKAHCIWGTYDYHHYMQDHFDDKGWGCAYRSLQTIWSWMRHQHYTRRKVPSHQEIQQALVDLGDKPRSFVGSKQWIGAIELGMILEARLGLTYRVLTVSSGADIESKAGELAQHFDQQGTPVMIGGGVLAYTLLGVHFDPATGECAFLILDPHYTGAESLADIQQGQWVAWKSLGGTAAAGGSLFRTDSFYNLLCPQRPKLV